MSCLDPNLDNLARIHDQYIDAYTEGLPPTDEELRDDLPPWVDDDECYPATREA